MVWQRGGHTLVTKQQQQIDIDWLKREIFSLGIGGDFVRWVKYGQNILKVKFRYFYFIREIIGYYWKD